MYGKHSAFYGILYQYRPRRPYGAETSRNTNILLMPLQDEHWALLFPLLHEVLFNCFFLKRSCWYTQILLSKRREFERSENERHERFSFLTPFGILTGCPLWHISGRAFVDTVSVSVGELAVKCLRFVWKFHQSTISTWPIAWRCFFSISASPTWPGTKRCPPRASTFRVFKIERK